MVYLQMHPYQTTGSKRGRKSLVQMGVKSKVIKDRSKLLNEKNQYVFRLRQILDKGIKTERDLDRIVKMGEKISQLQVQIDEMANTEVDRIKGEADA